jgi:hypothetical protein
VSPNLLIDYSRCPLFLSFTVTIYPNLSLLFYSVFSPFLFPLVCLSRIPQGKTCDHANASVSIRAFRHKLKKEAQRERNTDDVTILLYNFTVVVIVGQSSSSSLTIISCRF